MTQQKNKGGCAVAAAVAVLVMIIVAFIIVSSVMSSTTEKEPDLYIRDLFYYKEYVTFNIQNDGSTAYNNITVTVTYLEYGVEKSTEVFISLLEPYSQAFVSAGYGSFGSLHKIEFYSNEAKHILYDVNDTYSPVESTSGLSIMIAIVVIVFILIASIAVITAASKAAKRMQNQQSPYPGVYNNQQASRFGDKGQPPQSYTYKNTQTEYTQQRPNQTQQPIGNTQNTSDTQTSKTHDYRQQQPSSAHTTSDTQPDKTPLYQQLSGQLNQKAQQAFVEKSTAAAENPVVREMENIAPVSENWTTDFYIPEPSKPVQPDLSPVSIESDLLKQAHDGHICKNCGYKAGSKKHYCPNCLAPLDDDFTMH